MNTNGSFGGWLKQRRRALDLTQAELADQVACTMTTIQKIEADIRRPSKQIAERLADVLALALDARADFVSFARHVANHPPALPIDLTALTPASNLPSQPTPFLGRENELTQIAKRLADPSCRLLTLVGVGGIGKTRLAVQAAADQVEDFADGVYFVSLTPVGSTTLIAAAIASALQISFYGQEEPNSQVVNYLRSKHMLLVMDNYEHLLGGVELLTDLLANAPRLKILATSRERLNLQEEWVLPVDGLPFPLAPNKAELGSYSAVQLFVQTAHRLQPSFMLEANQEGVTDICQAVEGMPLGIELAATWLRAMPCDQIAGQIRRDLDFLATPLRNIPDRHRSLRTVFEHSWGLLSQAERNVLMTLSVFRGGIDPEAAQEVAQAPRRMLAGLVDKSFARLNAAGRFELHELLRQFAADKLEKSGEAVMAARGHFEFFLGLAEQGEVHLYDLHSEAWFNRLEVEHDNLRAALEWSLRDRQAEMGLRLAGALGFFWEQQGHTIEAYGWYKKLLVITSDAPALVRATALRLAGGFAVYFGDDSLGRLLCEESLILARDAGSKPTIAWSLGKLGFFVEAPSDLNRAALLLEEELSLFRELRDSPGIIDALRGLGWVVTAQGDYARAKMLLEEGLMLARAAGDKTGTAWAIFLLGNVIWFQTRDPHRALALYQESLTMSRELRNKNIPGLALFMIGQVARFQGDYERAFACCEESLCLVRERSSGGLYIAHILAGFAGLISVRGFPEQVIRLFGATDVHLHGYVGDHFPFGKPTHFDHDVVVAHAQLDEAQFAAAYAQGQAMTLDQAVAYALATATLIPPEEVTVGID